MALCAGAALLLAQPARPEPAQGEGADTAQARALAVEHQKKAEALYRKGQYPEALRASALAFEVYPTPRTAYNVAVIHKKLGQRAEAFDRCIAGLNLQPSADEKKRIEKLLAELGPQLAPPRGWVVVDSVPPAAEVQCAGERAVRGRAPIAIALPAGRGELVSNLEGHLPSTTIVEVTAGAPTAVRVELRPAARAVEVASATPAPVAAIVSPAEVSGDGRADAPRSATPPAGESSAAHALGLWSGVGVATLGLAAAVGSAISVLLINQHIEDPATTWVDRQQSARLGVAALGGGGLGLALILAGGTLSAVSAMDAAAAGAEPAR